MNHAEKKLCTGSMSIGLWKRGMRVIGNLLLKLGLKRSQNSNISYEQKRIKEARVSHVFIQEGEFIKNHFADGRGSIGYDFGTQESSTQIKSRGAQHDVNRRGREDLDNRHQMNILDQAIQVVKHADISSWSHKVQTNHKSLQEFLNVFLSGGQNSVIKDDNERERFLLVCLNLMNGATNEVQKRAAALVISSFYDNLLRSVLVEDLKVVFAACDSEFIKKQIIELSRLQNTFKKVEEKLISLNTQLSDTEKEVKEMAANKSNDAYVASLLYAADRWGTPTEKRYVKSLVKKISVKKEELVK